jgi:hypothetical protein
MEFEMATKAALKNGTRIPASDRKVASTDNEPEITYTVASFKTAIIELGEAAREAREGFKLAEGAVKRTAADGMLAFTRAAEQDVLTETNFGEMFKLWCFGKGTGEVGIAHASEKSRFMKAMKAGFAAKSLGISFVDVVANVKKTAEDMRAARAAAPKEAKKALPEARQPDLAVYNVLNRMAEKAGDKSGDKGMKLLTEAETLDAIKVTPGKAKATKAETTVEGLLQDMADRLNDMLKTLPREVRGQIKAARNALEEVVAELSETEETEEEAAETEAA